MPIPRKEQVNLDSTVFYHCTTRCVQQCFLLGIDPITGQNYEHRKEWIEQRIQIQASAFCIDVCAYAIMSNHTHLVLQVDPEMATDLTDEEVCLRWQKVAKLKPLVKRYLVGNCGSKEDVRAAKALITEYRRRLFDLSAFMGMLNWHIARRANKEQGRKGHFWESRFHSQALLDEGAVLACMAYVDLNPIRAKLATTLISSEYTSICSRLKTLQKTSSMFLLKPFSEKHQVEPQLSTLPCLFSDYLAILEATATRKFSTDMRSQNIIRFIGIRPTHWNRLVSQFEDLFDFAVGKPSQLRIFKHKQGRNRVRGVSLATQVFI